ncbi:MAG: sulfatase, partial [Planctomycetaceae bacterium]|nr:sulfatase [Planctomycetaceae bacterium]
EVIQSAEASSPHSVFHWQLGNQWVVREGNWKLLAHPRDTSGTPEEQKKAAVPNRMLINLAEDIGEKRNLVDQYPDIARKLEKQHEEWAQDLEK